MSQEKMTCVYCGKSKNWCDGFPSHIYAICWQCTWDQHCAAEHPISRFERLRMRRMARRAMP